MNDVDRFRRYVLDQMPRGRCRLCMGQEFEHYDGCEIEELMLLLDEHDLTVMRLSKLLDAKIIKRRRKVRR